VNEPYDVAAIVGSLRRGSLTRRLALALSELAPPTLKISIVEIRELSMYDADDEAAAPAPWVNFRNRIKGADAVLFATTEYNRSIPGALKNAIDIGSRPKAANVWDGKPAAIVSCSPGALGAFGANQHVRQCLLSVNMPTLQQPEAYIAHVDKLFDSSGAIANPASREFCGKFLDAFAQWIGKTRRV
jgi:chromate reductase